MASRALAAVIFGAALAPAQVRWERAGYAPPFAGSLAYDAARDRYVVLAAPTGPGAAETWEWDRSLGWLARPTSGSAPALLGGALAYDSTRGVTVLFHSYGGFPVSETWQWDGTVWSQPTQGLQPPARTGHAMAFDAARGRLVLFGGTYVRANYTLLGDTWEWDGTAWTQLSIPGPAARDGHAMTFDPARGEVVLFGGRASQASLGDVHAFDGVAWSPRPTGPAPRFGAALTFDPGRGVSVLFGGSSSYGAFSDDTWEWDGLSWTARTTPVRPSPRQSAGLAPDPVGGGVLLVGGVDAAGEIADQWRWDGAAWALVEARPQPSRRHSYAATFDELRGELLLFGGVGVTSILGDFWRWDGAAWSRAVVPGPAARSRAVMAYDVARGEAVMFGGELPGFTNETWRWDGGAWTFAAPSPTPSPRVLHAMAYDRQRSRVVLFGGASATGFLGDTWEWDGATWLLRSVPGPLARHGHAIAYDESRGVVVLYGGTSPGGPFGTIQADTWEWDGSAWLLRQPANSPGPRREFAMAYDAARGRVVMFGDPVDDSTWEWDGVDWIQRAPVDSPAARARTSLVYDTWRERTWLFGGQGPRNGLDLWDYAPVAPATTAPFGAGCGGAAGAPTLVAGGRPWLGDSVPLALTNGPSSAAALWWFGASMTAFAGAPLPASLAGLGLPGCELLVGPDVVLLAIADASGASSSSLPVPNQPALLGLEVHAQGAFADRAANVGGIVVSPGLTLRLGGR